MHKFFKLPGKERHLLAIALILLSSIRLGLWFLEFRVLLKILKKIGQVHFPIPILPKEAMSVGKIVWAVNVTSKLMPFGVKCLARALTTQVLMSRCGYLSELRIGVARSKEGKLEAHAWIEYQGRVAIGNLLDLSRFTPLPSLEGVKL